MTLLAVVVVALAAIGALCYVVHRLLAENKRLVAIATAPHQAAAHVAALDRPRREKPDTDERTLRPVGS